MGFKVNEKFADHYDSYRRKETLQRFRDRFGSSEDDSTSEEEEDDPQFTKKSTVGFLKTLDALKRNDPSIYDEKTKFYETDSESDSENGKPNISKNEKIVTLKDYQRHVVLQKGGIVDEEEEDFKDLTKPSTSGKSFKEEQEEIHSEFKRLAESSSDSSDDEMFTRDPVKPSTSSAKLEDIDWNKLRNDKLDEKEKFVKQYLMKAAWNEEESDQDYSSGEELVSKRYHKEEPEVKQENDEESDGEDLFVERKLVTNEEKTGLDVMNTKFEREEDREPKSYPRGGVPGSLRQDTAAEKKSRKRQEKKEKKLKKEKEYKENMARIKHIKEEELMAKMNELKEALGVSEIDLDPSLLKGDFDDDKHDQLVEQLMTNLGEDNFDEDGELLKPVFSDLEEIEEEYEEEKKKAKRERKQKKKRGGRGRIRETDDYEAAKEKFPEIAKEIDSLDYQVDMVGETACRFKYREVESEDYGLTAEELFSATDAELNQWVGLKRVTQWTDDGFTDNKFWTNPKKMESKKRQIFKSIYAEREEGDEVPEPKKSKKINSKRRRKLKERQLLEEADNAKEGKSEDCENEEDEEVSKEPPKKKEKKKGRKHKGDKLANITEDRFSSYGLTKDEIKKMKYAPNQQLKYDV